MTHSRIRGVKDILTNKKSFDSSNLTTALYEKDEALAEDPTYFNKAYTVERAADRQTALDDIAAREAVWASDIKSSFSGKKSNKFKIAYTGALYDDRKSYRDITPILKAISKLVSKSRIDANAIAFIYCSTSSAQYAQQFELYPLFRL